MKKFAIQIILLLAVVFGALFLFYNQNFLSSVVPENQTQDQKQIKINDNTIAIEVADTSSKRNKGLSGRDSLASSSGMLFVFQEEKKYRFWMKDMKFPLDFIFISKSKVVDIIKNVQPSPSDMKDSDLPVYEPISAIDMLLEVNSGFTDSHNIKAGDQVYLVK